MLRKYLSAGKAISIVGDDDTRAAGPVSPSSDSRCGRRKSSVACIQSWNPPHHTLAALVEMRQQLYVDLLSSFRLTGVQASSLKIRATNYSYRSRFTEFMINNLAYLMIFFRHIQTPLLFVPYFLNRLKSLD